MNNSNLPGLLMGLLSILCLVIVFIYLRKGMARTAWSTKQQDRIFYISLSLTITWLIIIGILARSGFFADFSQLPPRPVIAILLPLPFVLWVAFSNKFKPLQLSVPSHWFIFFQSFRVFVELLLWLAFIKGAMPQQMTFEGRNWDIIVGILAFPAGWWVMQRKNGYRTIIILFNIAGLLLLLNVLTVAVLSMPVPFRYFMNEPSLEKVGKFPMIYLPAVLVVLAYSIHILSLRQSWLMNKHRKSNDSTLALS